MSNKVDPQPRHSTATRSTSTASSPGFTQAFEDGDVVTFPHTEVFDEFEGQGLASELVTGALDDIRAQGKKVVATCPYVARFIEKHPDYADLLA